jgi:transposase
MDRSHRLNALGSKRRHVSGLLEEVWTPDERTRTLRRLTNRRERIVRARTRAKNEAHGVLARNLCERPSVTDAFGKAGRRWLAELELPVGAAVAPFEGRESRAPLAAATPAARAGRLAWQSATSWRYACSACSVSARSRARTSLSE